eukprot:scaffold8545_cov76-Skeletonema_dohrnii-CCMP3373.AAC.3
MHSLVPPRREGNAVEPQGEIKQAQTGVFTALCNAIYGRRLSPETDNGQEGQQAADNQREL